MCVQATNFVCRTYQGLNISMWAISTLDSFRTRNAVRILAQMCHLEQNDPATDYINIELGNKTWNERKKCTQLLGDTIDESMSCLKTSSLVSTAALLVIGLLAKSIMIAALSILPGYLYFAAPNALLTINDVLEKYTNEGMQVPT